MYSDIKQQLFSNWHAMRVVRAVLSLIIIAQAISLHDGMLGAFGGVFMLMAVLNTGCCGNACNTQYKETANIPPGKENKKIDFEEIK